MKKILSLILMIAFVLSMATSAFAAETNNRASEAAKAVSEGSLNLSVALDEERVYTFDDGSAIEVSCTILPTLKRIGSNTVDYKYRETGIGGVLIGEYHLYTEYESAPYYVYITDTWTSVRTGPAVISNSQNSTIVSNNNTSAKSRGTFVCTDILGSFTRILTTTLTGGFTPVISNEFNIN